MKRAPLTYRRPTGPPEKLARLRALERDFHVRAFGEELARVNLDLSPEDRRRYLDGMRQLSRRKGSSLPLRSRGVPYPRAR